ncbi:cytochrome c oxidase subunit II [Oceanobacillus profundus]|uniref:Cytochrome c oxidase subunit 2 n=1 Tax=Oceanobacillus profundus TaxID=372463 RepID=A0A417YKU7_9BACI|nr:cytochrome c oxidase subunit II [Oceanobacillus profundus]MBR3119987.1 cytochrome c oxidase subunit II [Oceanobacillus sp.]PAE30151.1 cytochrome c oxidase subunit II [Paenibacillus sp. 7884-2]MCM3396219.1 cytochrome c oxidase subunit II [Oceanobacillus profundus]MDO6449771.1 cytochrome c oxidase subunit II [Oceanobacillus profundus]RHW33773.1 cytochrome c oxidase subunit II [Oceanobacillus profundus]
MKGWMGKTKALLLFTMLSLFLTACGKENLTALVPKGYGAESSMNLIILTTLIMVGVFVVVMIIYVIALVRFRRKKGQEDFIPKQVEGNHTLETVWTIIPIVLVLIMGVPTVIATFDLADTSNASENINIEVTGNQYWWHFNYDGEEIVTSQDLYIPTGERVYLNMQSSDVIHSFWVPSISGKMDVSPENVNTMYIEAFEEGVYWGKCAELCGPSHSLMDFKVIAVSPEEYDQWLSDMQAVDPEQEPQDTVAQEGKELFEANNCMACHAIGSSPAATGPNLTNFGDRTTIAGILEPTKENLIDWIMDPESIKPGNKMTGAYPSVSEEEANSIAEYLLQLKPSEITPESAGN